MSYADECVANARQRVQALREARLARLRSLEGAADDDEALAEIVADLQSAISRGAGARDHILLAETELMRGGTLDAVRAAEHAAREAIGGLDCSVDGELAVAAWRLLGEALTSLVQVTDEQQRKRIESAREVLFAGESLALLHDDALRLAQLRDSLSRVLGERFRFDRDENLSDAVVCGEQTLPALRGAHSADSPALPSLLNHLGNCCVKISTGHRDWLRRGLGHYRDGLGVVDALRYPRLQRMLADSVAMAEGLLAQDPKHDHLPEQEMVSRFASAVQDALDGADHDGAWRWAMGFLRWAWNLDETPNVHAGEAHKLLGRLAVQHSSWDQAEHHLYQAVLVLAGVLPLKHRWRSLVEEAIRLFEDALTRAGREPLAAGAIAQARWALSGAQEALADAERVPAEQVTAALDRAIGLYPDFPPALEARAHHHLQANALGESMRDAETCLALQPDNIVALSVRAAVLTRSDQHEPALMAWKAVLEHDPANEAALATSANLLAQLTRWEEARAHADRLIAATPALPAAYLLRASCRANLDDAAGAISDLEKARPAITDPAGLAELDKRIAELRAR